MSPHWPRRAQRVALLFTVLLFSAGYATVGLLILLLTLAWEGIQTRRFPWRRSGIDWAILLFLITFFVSGWLSPHRAVALGAAGAGALSIYVALGSLRSMLAQDRGFVRSFLIAWVVGAVGTAVWAVSLHQITGRPAFTPELGQNAVGTTLLVGLALGTGLLLVARGTWQAVLGVGCVALMVGLLLTTARGAWLGGAVALVTVLLLGGTRRPGRGLAAIALIVLLGIGVLATQPGLLRRAVSISSLQANQDRLFMFRSAWAIFVDHPLVGTGMNTFSLVYPNYRFPNDPNPQAQPFAHNVFLNMLAEGGLLGFAAFVTILVQAAIAGWRWYAGSRNPRDAILSAATLAAFLGMVVHQIFDGTIISVHVGAGLWFLIALMIGAGPKDAPGGLPS